ncbi:hypothetical protein [Serinibacter salmoneus]|uniref:hypothetical protein n=1 Tax=Serinibacter salmoneus TaxID=556530 RepID=UPI00117AEB66|nr:hypothetical protein [Serinibacter salmoneus]
MELVAGVVVAASGLILVVGEFAARRRSRWRSGSLESSPPVVWLVALAVALIGVLSFPGEKDGLLVVLLAVLVPGGFGAVINQRFESTLISVLATVLASAAGLVLAFS